MKYFHLTILRNGKYENVVFSSDLCQSPQAFLTFDLALGHETFILYAKEINSHDYYYLDKQINKK